MKCAAIDIGSNAVRLLVSRVEEVDGRPHAQKLAYYRVPIRLGADVFSTGAVSDKRLSELTKAMKAFWHLMDVHGIDWFRACATSAMREATNAKAVLKYVKKRANVNIEIISGDEEADLIFSNFNAADFDQDKDYLYIDVGGGSTELTLIRHGKRIKGKSFKLGTVRALQNQIPDGEWDAVYAYIGEISEPGRPLYAIGTGGNANRLQRLALLPRHDAVSLKKLLKLSDALASASHNERMSRFHLKPDRAEVIVPAADIYTRVMQLAQATHMHVPKVGLSDGMVLAVYKAWKASEKG